jgi:hypothetical protein
VDGKRRRERKHSDERNGHVLTMYVDTQVMLNGFFGALNDRSTKKRKKIEIHNKYIHEEGTMKKSDNEE